MDRQYQPNAATGGGSGLVVRTRPTEAVQSDRRDEQDATEIEERLWLHDEAGNDVITDTHDSTDVPQQRSRPAHTGDPCGLLQNIVVVLRRSFQRHVRLVVTQEDPTRE